ncbi:hypothetical protein J4442_05485 [Candidatus Woesearchaeota archaeon]|nr:hypothetical protein [Candidatus Woesearchaeota archaeon]
MAENEPLSQKEIDEMMKASKNSDRRTNGEQPKTRKVVDEISLAWYPNVYRGSDGRLYRLPRDRPFEDRRVIKGGGRSLTGLPRTIGEKIVCAPENVDFDGRYVLYSFLHKGGFIEINPFLRRVYDKLTEFGYEGFKDGIPYLLLAKHKVRDGEVDGEVDGVYIVARHNGIFEFYGDRFEGTDAESYRNGLGVKLQEWLGKKTIPAVIAQKNLDDVCLDLNEELGLETADQRDLGDLTPKREIKY